MWLNGYQKPVMGLLYKIAAHAKLFISGNYYTVIRQHLQRKSFAAFCFIISGLFFFLLRKGRLPHPEILFCTTQSWFMPPLRRLWAKLGSNPELPRGSLVSANGLDHWATTAHQTELQRPTLSYHVPHWATTSHTELPRPTLSYHVP
jgi:hypothetical protein